MEIQNAFDRFLEKQVNLNTDRVKRIEKAQQVLSDFVSSREDFKKAYRQTLTQGSYRQKTIIKPINNENTFDVDLLIELDKFDGWAPKDYLENLAKAFKDSGRYKDLTDTNGKHRCVTIDYEGDFNADIVPAIRIDGEYYICNKKTNKYELSDGDGYAQWFDGQNTIANGFLIPVVRLLKYLRDFNSDFDTKSIILTTIAGGVINTADFINGKYNNIPITLASVLSAMQKYLSQFQTPPSIENPAMPNENFDRHWKNDSEGFNKLKASISTYAEIANKAINAGSERDALKFWQELFGDNFETSDAKVKSGGSGGSSILETPVPFTPQKPWTSEYV